MSVKAYSEWIRQRYHCYKDFSNCGLYQASSQTQLVAYDFNSEISSLNGACEKINQDLKIYLTFSNEYNYCFDKFPLTTDHWTGLIIASSPTSYLTHEHAVRYLALSSIHSNYLK